jgi:hypothetical protein
VPADAAPLTVAELIALGSHTGDEHAAAHTAAADLATHCGVVTIQNTATGVHRTFCIKLQTARAKFAPGRRVVSLLTGPDSMRDWRGFGFATDAGTVAVYRKLRATTGPASTWQGLARMLGELIGSAAPTFNHTPYTVHAATRCRACGRSLSHPVSIAAGIGPKCAGRAK